MDEPQGLTARTVELMRRRSWRALSLEVVLIVVGVLAALAIDGAAENRRDRIAEAEYLELLARDLSQTVDQLETVHAAADRTVAAGLGAYRELSSRKEPIDYELIATGVSALTGRLSVRPFEATYRELLSTGNLSLIRSGELRDAVVTYHEAAELNYDTFARNRAFFNDDVFALFVIEEALITPYVREHPVPVVNEVVDGLIASLGPEYEAPPERIVDLEPGTSGWDQLRSRVWVTVVATEFLAVSANQMRQDAEALRQRLRDELDR